MRRAVDVSDGDTVSRSSISYVEPPATAMEAGTVMTNEDDHLRNETLDQLYDLAPGASRGWWCGARDDPQRVPRVRIVHQLISDGFMNATFGDDDWVVSAQLTPRGWRDVNSRRACALGGARPRG
jgi:hypothetical protein